MASIGDLVANLRANAAPLQSGLATGLGAIKQFASGARSAIAPIGGMFSQAFSVSGMLQAAGERGRAEKMLASQVAATGEAAGLSTRDMIAYAQSLQRTTSFSAVATEGAMSLLTTFRNIKGDQFKDAIKQAQNLSTVMGVDLNEATRLVGKALNDPANSMKLLRKEGILFTAQQQQQIASMQAAGNVAGAQKVILAGLESSFGGAAENMASPMAMLHNAITDVSASLGSVLGPGIKVIAESLTEILGPLEEARGALQGLGKLVAGFIGAVMKPFATGIAQTAQLLMGMFVGGSVTAADFGNVANLAMDNVTLGVMKLLPNGEKIFTAIGVYGAAAWEAISAGFWAQWENVRSGWNSMVGLSKAVGSAIYAAMSAAWNLEDPIAAAKGAWSKAMAEMQPTNFSNPYAAAATAFENTVHDATQGLQEQGGLTKVLTVDRDRLKANVQSALNGVKGLMPSWQEPQFKKKTQTESGVGGKGAGKSKTSGGGERDDKLEAFEANSREALTQLAQASRGDDAQDRIADACERTAAAAERGADAGEKTADQHHEVTNLGT